MARLQNRNRQIPNGLKFYDANLRWSPPNNASFSVICDGLRSARLANPGITRAKGLATGINQIEDEVDSYNAAICQQMGWTDFITGSAGGLQVPFPQGQSHPPSSLASRLSNVAAGSSVIVEWISSGSEAVPQEQSDHRAEVCSKCPMNKKGDWSALFTIPAANAIRSAIKNKGEFGLSTPYDDQLGICEACDCCLVLKTHVPFHKFYPKMSQAAKDALDVNCWIRAESK